MSLSFQQYYTEKHEAMELVDATTNNNTLEGFLRDTVVGKSIKEILDMSTYVRLYFGNKYGIGPRYKDDDQALTDFINYLGNFINRGISQARAERDAVFKEPFTTDNNYEEYQQVDKLRKLALRKFFTGVRDTDDEGEKERIRAEYEREKQELSNKVGQTEFYQAWQKREKEITQWVDNFHRTPISWEDVAPDDSKHYRNLVRAWDNLQRVIKGGGYEDPHQDSSEDPELADLDAIDV